MLLLLLGAAGIVTCVGLIGCRPALEGAVSKEACEGTFPACVWGVPAVVKGRYLPTGRALKDATPSLPALLVSMPMLGGIRAAAGIASSLCAICIFVCWVQTIAWQQ
jgi:hypothetical protein